jgi:hypothetical protein
MEGKKKMKTPTKHKTKLLNHLETGFLTSFNQQNPPYNPLFDRHLFSYFHNVNVIKVLRKNKIVIIHLSEDRY